MYCMLATSMSLNGWENCCLDCGCKTLIGDRKMLGSDASRRILLLWEKVLELELQRCGKKVNKMTLIGDGIPRLLAAFTGRVSETLRNMESWKQLLRKICERPSYTANM